MKGNTARPILAPPWSVLWILLLAMPAPLAAEWVNPPSNEAKKAIHGLQHHTFESKFMKRKVGYNVILPPSYGKKDGKRYPVIYWLHGGGGNESSSLFTARAWLDLYQSDEHEIGEVILVYPNGQRSGYMDHHDGKIMAESMIIRELIPRVDRQFRTIAKREGRAVHGFSMGSSGACRFATKYPGLFCSAIVGGGGAIDIANSTDPFILKILKRNLDDDPDLVRQHNTYHYLKEKGEILRKRDTRFMVICGENDRWLQSGVKFKAALDELEIECRLVRVPGIGHNARELYKAKGSEAALFQDRIFKEASAKPER